MKASSGLTPESQERVRDGERERERERESEKSCDGGGCCCGGTRYRGRGKRRNFIEGLGRAAAAAECLFEESDPLLITASSFS